MFLKKESKSVSWILTIIIILSAAVAFGSCIVYSQVYMSTVKASSFEEFLKYANDTDKKLTEHEEKQWLQTTAKDKKRVEQREQAAKETAEAVKAASLLEATTIDASTCNPSSSHNDPTKIDVLINKKHCIQPLTFEPADLVSSNGATLKQAASVALDSLLANANAAGHSMYVTSSYRSYQTQAATYEYWVGISGRDGADTYSARPGYSEHQTGLAVDFASSGCALDCFGTTPAYQWMMENAANYGFIQRYYSGYEHITGYTSEEWHYRYVGQEVAKDMRQKGIMTLEEYWSFAGGGY